MEMDVLDSEKGDKDGKTKGKQKIRAQQHQRKTRLLCFGGVVFLWTGSSSSCGVPVLVQDAEPARPYVDGTL